MISQNQTNRRRGRRGFTLVELLVGMSLTIFIMSLFTVLFVHATGSVEQMRGITAVDQSVRSVVNIIRKDLDDIVATEKPHQLFTTSGSFGLSGYLLIEENSPAIRQGVDEYGQPVIVDTDDIIQFTAKREGNGPSEMFYGRVPLGGFLDNYSLPKSRYDDINNGLFSSDVAEIVYFLRPDKRQYTVDELRGHDGTTPNVLTTTLTSPATFTLYRRQLVVLQDVGTATAANGQNIPTVNFYRDYDISAKPDPTNPTIMRFNLLSDPASGLQIRANRFGLNHQNATNSVSGNNDFPYSWSYPAAGGSGSYVSGAIYNPLTANAQWLGRPTSLETNITGADPFAILATAFANPNVDSNLNGIVDADGTPPLSDRDAAYTSGASITDRYGDDVLLKNVLSFDIKVFDDDPRFEADPVIQASGPDPGSGLATPAVNPLRAGTGLGAVTEDQRAPEFVDLGYRAPVPDVWTTINSEYETSANGFSFADSATTNNGFGFKERWRHPGRNAAESPAAPDSVYVPLRTYDSWSSTYMLDPALAAPVRPIPYPRPLRAIQINLRILEPRFGIVREVTLIHRFKD